MDSTAAAWVEEPTTAFAEPAEATAEKLSFATRIAKIEAQQKAIMDHIRTLVKAIRRLEGKTKKTLRAVKKQEKKFNRNIRFYTDAIERDAIERKLSSKSWAKKLRGGV